MADQNPRYVAYAASMGLTPEEAIERDRIEWPGGIMTGFILWTQEQWQAWSAASGQRAAFGPGTWSAGQHVLFDAWLRERYLTRPVYGRERSFHEWLRDNNVDPATLASDDEVITLVGQMAFPRRRTGREKSKQDALAARVRKRKWLHEQYMIAEPPKVVGRRPVDMTREADRAWARTQRRREAAAGTREEVSSAEG